MVCLRWRLGFDSLIFRIGEVLWRSGAAYVGENLGRSENWSALESSEAVQSAIVTYGIKTIEFPRLSPHKLATIDAQRMTFSAARDSTDLGLIGRSQIVTYLKTAYAALDQSGWTPGAALNPPPARKGEPKS